MWLNVRDGKLGKMPSEIFLLNFYSITRIGSLLYCTKQHFKSFDRD